MMGYSNSEERLAYSYWLRIVVGLFRIVVLVLLKSVSLTSDLWLLTIYAIFLSFVPPLFMSGQPHGSICNEPRLQACGLWAAKENLCMLANLFGTNSRCPSCIFYLRNGGEKRKSAWIEKQFQKVVVGMVPKLKLSQSFSPGRNSLLVFGTVTFETTRDERWPGLIIEMKTILKDQREAFWRLDEVASGPWKLMLLVLKGGTRLFFKKKRGPLRECREHFPSHWCASVSPISGT